MPIIIGKDDTNIPLADDDPQVIVGDEVENDVRNMDFRCIMNDMSLIGEIDSNLSEQEEKARLISQVLELQNTLDDLSQRIDNVKEENLKVRSENQVLSQYIENLMSASSVFQSTSPKTKKN